MRIFSMWICLAVGVMAFMALALSHPACAGELGCAACEDEGWSGIEKLDQIGKGVESEKVPPKLNMAQLSRTVRWNESLHGFDDSNSSKASSSAADSSQAASWEIEGSSDVKDSHQNNSTAASSSKDTASPMPSVAAISRPGADRSFEGKLAPLSDVSEFDVILDVSDGAKKYIPGAVHVNYMDFLDRTKLKPAPKLAEILGDAGISRDMSVGLVGKCAPCGGGPSVKTYVYLMMKMLGHEDLKVIDGEVEEWMEAGLPAMNNPSILPEANYTPELDPSLLVTYDYVSNAGAQIIDARTFQEYSAGYIPGAVNIPYDMVMDEEGHIKGRAELADLFGGLSLDRPVVVYTTTGIKASMVWFALDLMGYDARVYTWQDWVDHQPKLQIALINASATPNPAGAGDAVKLVAVFGPVNSTEANPSPSSESRENLTVLTIMGCATCGFGSPQAFAGVNPNSAAGGIQLGTSGKSGGDGFVCTAVITNSTGGEVKRINMQRVVEDEFSGTWKADVSPGRYNLNLLASASGASKAFSSVLTIVVNASDKDFSSVRQLGRY